MSIYSWVRKRFSLSDPRAAEYFGIEDNWAGRRVTPHGAMNLSIWYRAIKLHADVTGGLPIKFYERKSDGSRVQVRDHDVSMLLNDPNSEDTKQDFWSAYAAQLASQGNGFAEKRYLSPSSKRPSSLEMMPPDTHVYRDSDGDIQYRFQDRGKTEELPKEKVFHTKAFSFGGIVGVSALTSARQSLSISLATEEAVGKTYAQGMRLSGFFTGPKLEPDQRTQFTKTFIDPIIGNDAKAHYGILENGFDFKPINIPPKDAEMLLSRRFNAEDLARYMGTPPVLLGHSAEGQTMWGTGVEAIINMWLTLGYDTFLSNIEGSIRKWIMIAEDRPRFYAEFDRRAILRNDSAARSELYWKMVQVAGLTPNQVCDKENEPRFEGGDVRLINSTLIPLDQAGQVSKGPPQP